MTTGMKFCFQRHPLLLPLLGGILVLLAGACQESDLPGKEEPFDLSGMLSHLGENVILPDLDRFQQQTGSLEEATEAFANEPSLARLEHLKQAWFEAYLAYQRVSLYAFGPAMDQGFSMRDRLNVFPTNFENIENNIGSHDMDANFKSLVGFPAMEYLLYGLPNEAPQQVLARFVNNPDERDRLEYLLALARDIDQKAKQIHQGWIASGGNYLQAFVASDGTGEGSSLGLLVNEFNFDYELLKNFKFKIPLGKFDGGVVQPQKAEGYFAGNSIALATAQLEALQAFYLGKTASGTDGPGFDDFLVHLNAGADQDGLLAEAIRRHFEEALQQLATLNDPLSEELATNKEAVDEVHTRLQMMVPLIKREMTSALGVKITYQDNDGD